MKSTMHSLASVWQRLVIKITQHRFGALVFIGTILLSITGVISTIQYLDRKELRHFAALEKIEASYQALQASDADYQKKLQEIQQQLDNFRKSHSGGPQALANFYLAEIYYQQKQYNEAIAAYKIYHASLPRGTAYRALIATNIGYAYEELKQPQVAAEYFLEAATTESFPQRDAALMGAARAYENAGVKDNAKRYYQKVVDDFPESTLEPMARYKIQQLSSHQS